VTCKRIVERKLIPRLKDKDPELVEDVELDYVLEKVTYRPQLPKNPGKLDIPIYYPKVVQYSLCYKETLPEENSSENNLHVAVLQLNAILVNDEEDVGQHLKQISERLLKKLNAWSLNHMKPGGYKPISSHNRVIGKDEFSSVYEGLKRKYKVWIDKWPEKTDAVKFVYEDIAIATYLICLWKREENENTHKFKYKFLDLGCGNGFLVYLLTCEGYVGYGLDLHKRSIWDQFDVKVDLRMQVIDPSQCRFPEAEWILGNHSDEITPWIPIITRRSSNFSKFWVLPCCFYQLGRKFDSPVPKGGRYRAYLNYVKEMAEQCGFLVQEDAIRIPSTKNICFIGIDRNLDDQTIEENFKHALLKESFASFTPRESPAGKKARH
jgi:hypothetical protein